MYESAGTKYVCRHCLATTTVRYEDAMVFFFGFDNELKNSEIRELLPDEEGSEEDFFVYEAGYCDACFETHRDPKRITPTKVFELRDKAECVHKRYKNEMDTLIERHLGTVIDSLTIEQIEKIIKHPLRPKRRRKQLMNKREKLAAYIARQLFEIDEIAALARAYDKEVEKDITSLKEMLGEEGIDYYYTLDTNEVDTHSILIDPIPIKDTPRVRYHIETTCTPSQILGWLTLAEKDYRYSLNTEELIDGIFEHIRAVPTGDKNEI